MRASLALLKRDLLLTFRNPGLIVNPLLFYLLVVTLVPLGVGANQQILQDIAPGIIWLAALLATLLALDSLFRNDLHDGSLEQLALSPTPFAMLTGIKILVHWLITGLPLILLSPLFATLFSLSADATGVLAITLLLGTPVLSAVGAIGAALTVSIRNSGALLALIVLPLYVPILIFAAGAVSAAQAGLPVTGQLYFLAALLVLSVTLAPIATSAALKINL
ncbi:MAG: heme exporter protein CcmB [Gammaproteobacteria bacterium]|nr:heme exporter protein CcmB [Gammaproteobacteria bacterium]